MPNCLIDPNALAVPVSVVGADGFAAWLQDPDARTRGWIDGAGVRGQGG